MYWHPQHGAHPISGEILRDWASQGYERGSLGYPIDDATTDDNIRFSQKFERGALSGYREPVPQVAHLLNINKKDIDTFYERFNQLNKDHGVGLKAGWDTLLQQAAYSADATRREAERLENTPNNRVNPDQSVMFRPTTLNSGARNDCRADQLVVPGNERTNRGDLFYSGATTTVKNVDVNHGHTGIFASVRGNSNPDLVDTVQALNKNDGIRKVKGSEGKGVCSPRYLSVDVDQQTRYRAADFADSKINPDGYDDSAGSYALSRSVTADTVKFNCASLVWAAYMHASGGRVDIADSRTLPLGGYKPAVFPVDILNSVNTREFE